MAKADLAIDRPSILKAHFAIESVSDISRLLVLEHDARHAPVFLGMHSDVEGLIDYLSIGESTVLSSQGVLSAHYKKNTFDAFVNNRGNAGEDSYIVQVAAKTDHWHQAVASWAKTKNIAEQIRCTKVEGYPGLVNYAFSNRDAIVEFCTELDNKAFDFAAQELKEAEMGVSTEQAHYISWEVR